KVGRNAILDHEWLVCGTKYPARTRGVSGYQAGVIDDCGYRSHIVYVRWKQVGHDAVAVKDGDRGSTRLWRLADHLASRGDREPALRGHAAGGAEVRHRAVGVQKRVRVGDGIGVAGDLTTRVDGEPTAAGPTEGAEVGSDARRIEEGVRRPGCGRYAPGHLSGRVNSVGAGARPEVDQRIFHRLRVRSGKRVCQDSQGERAELCTTHD